MILIIDTLLYIFKVFKCIFLHMVLVSWPLHISELLMHIVLFIVYFLRFKGNVFQHYYKNSFFINFTKQHFRFEYWLEHEWHI